MLVASIFAASLNFSAFRCVALPWPAEAKFMLPGLARAAASNCGSVLMFLPGEITSALGSDEMGVTPAKSCTVSKGSLAKVEGLTVCDDEWIITV
jgi:hypothetical protein